jgi:hypothetical protein
LLAHSEVRAAVGRGHWLDLAIEGKCTHGQERERYINNTSKREESVGKTPDSPPTCGYAQCDLYRDSAMIGLSDAAA